MESNEWQTFIAQSFDVRPKPDDRERFLSKVHVEGDCWLWRGANTFHIAGRSLVPRRVAFAMLRGRVNKGDQIISTCRNHCCMPGHLAIVHGETAETVSQNKAPVESA